MNYDTIIELFKCQGRQEMLLQVILRKLSTREEYDILIEKIGKEVDDMFKDSTTILKEMKENGIDG